LDSSWESFSILREDLWCHPFNATEFLAQLERNTAAFERAYKAFGESIISAYGIDVVAEAYSVSLRSGTND
jgi:hypothetical protein